MVPVDSGQVDVPASVIEAGAGIGIGARAPAGHGRSDYPIAPDVLVRPVRTAGTGITVRLGRGRAHQSPLSRPRRPGCPELTGPSACQLPEVHGGAVPVDPVTTVSGPASSVLCPG